VIAAATPESQLLDPTLTFRKTFLPIAILSVALVLLLSVIEVRRIMVPLYAVLDGMRRVAARDFGSPVPVLDRDEFGPDGRVVNSMTAQLGLHFRTLSAFAEIDRTILTTVEHPPGGRHRARLHPRDLAHQGGQLGLLRQTRPAAPRCTARRRRHHAARRAAARARPGGRRRQPAQVVAFDPAAGPYRRLLHEHGANFCTCCRLPAPASLGRGRSRHNQKTSLSNEQRWRWPA